MGPLAYRCPGPCCGTTAWPHQLCGECRGLARVSMPIPAPAKMHTKRVRWTPDLTAQLVADYQAGDGASLLAAKYGACTDTVLRRLREAGITIRPRREVP